MPHEIWIKGILCLLAVPVVLFLDRPGPRFSPRRASQHLWLAAVVAVAAYYNLGGFHGTGYVHYWETFHYHLGSKYFPELGYDGLYAASLAAQLETAPEMAVQPWIRDLADNQVVSAEAVGARRDEIVSRFTPTRWARFRADHLHFLRTMRWDYLQDVRKDHGYNPTPTWTFTARLLAGWLPTERTTLRLLASLDPLLLATLFAFLFRTYGSRLGCLCLIVFGLGYPWRFDWIGGAYLRLDWLAAVGIAICLLPRERFRTAGALFAYAGMVRIFPFLFLLGPAVLALRGLVRRERLAWAWRMGQGLALGVLLCLAAGSLTGRGPGVWGEFAGNLKKHHGTWLTNNVGLQNLLLYDGPTFRRDLVDFSLPEPWLHWQEVMNRRQQARRPWLVAAGLLLTGLVAAAAWREELDRAAVVGIAVVFALTLLTCYYWIMLLLVPLRGDRIAAATLLGLSAGLYGLHLTTPAFELIYGITSWALAALALLWITPAAWRTLRRGGEDPPRLRVPSPREHRPGPPAARRQGSPAPCAP